MKEDTRSAAKHEFEHAAPTVIHDPEQDMTILARWVHRGIQQGPKFWYLLAGVVVVVVLISTLISGLSAGGSSVSKAWSELNAAQTPKQKAEIADTYAGSEIARVARLQAASDYFFTATRDLPANRDAAGPQLQLALEHFKLAAKDSPKDSPEALAAAMGIARTLEARNELPEAIDAYKAVVSGWPGTPEAEDARRYAERLADPEVVAFYKELYTYKAPASALPSGIPGLPPDHPPLGGPAMPGMPLSTQDLLKSLTAPPLGSAPPGPAPLDIEAPPLSPPATKAEPAKPAELPKDPFAPADKPKS